MAGPSKWITLDTRTLGHDRTCKFDGFFHLIPRGLHGLHLVDIVCWCEPKVSWLEHAGTLLVSHRDKRPKEKKK